ncbi:MAG: hypothetical protein IJR60_01270 [Eubacterium sp.]|nr:hypothetical protein [Eubacterium sp.]
MSDELKEKVENSGEVNENEGVNILDLADEEPAETPVEEVIEENEAQDEPSDELDNPLVVHKKSDSSYLTQPDVDDEEDEDDDDGEVTLKRHRYRKEKKKGGKGVLIWALIFAAVAVIAALYFTGNLSFSPQNTTTQKAEVTDEDEESTTTLQDKYKGTIVVKGTYLFVDGEEVDGIEGLQSALEYEDKSTTAYIIIDEGANKDFLNYDVLDILTQLGFYDKQTKIEHLASTGLVAAAETTTLPPETTTKATTKKAADKKQETTTKKAE